MTNKIAVVGGGLGGLAAAIRLAAKGHTVDLYEKNATLGGKMNEYRLGPYRFDTGPSLITMPFVIDELFQSAGHTTDDFITLKRTEPVCRYFFPDGAVFDASSDMETMLASIEKLSPQDVDNYQRFMQYAQRIYRLTAEQFLLTPLHEPAYWFTRRNLVTLMQAYRIDPFRTVHQAVQSFFHDPRLIQLFDRYSTYNGSDPFQAPATLNIIPWVELGLGGYTIRGGLYRLVEALVRLATDLGVTIHTNAQVTKILHNHGRVNGIMVHNESIPANTIVCNADVVTAVNQLLDGHERVKRKLNKFEPSLSGLVLLLGMKQQQLLFKHHNIIFSQNYRKEFMQLFHDKIAPDDPTIYISRPQGQSRDDAQGLFVLLNMPYLASGQNWADISNNMRSLVLNRLHKLGVDTQIEQEKVITPQDLKSWYHSNKGSIYGISSNNRTMAFKRPANRARYLQGLYFAGGSVHPGGGVPLALLSGKMAADLINLKQGRKNRKQS